MNPLTLEWVEKAEGDLATSMRELRARRQPNYDAACFHSQQVAEKYLKAWLQENSIPIPRTHHLIELMALCLEVDSTFLVLENDLKGLDGYAVRFRYPGNSTTKPEARKAVQTAKAVRKFIRFRLGLEE